MSAGTGLNGADPYTVLYSKYGWDGTGDFNAVSDLDAEGVTLTGSEYVAEQVFKEMCSPMDATGLAGTMWIYSGNGVTSAYNPYVGDSDPVLFYSVRAAPVPVVTNAAGDVTYTVTTDYVIDAGLGLINRVATGSIGDGDTVLVTYEWGNATAGWTLVEDEAVVLSGTTKVELSFKAETPAWAKWAKANRAKSRVGHKDYAGVAGQYHRYGWAWLLNRRIMYNNGELAGDVADVFVAPAFLSRLWCIGGTNTLADWSTLYRTYSQLADMPDAGTGSGGVHVHPNRFPAFTEPYESPYDGTNGLNLVSTWGRNMGGAAGGGGTLTRLVWEGAEATPIGTAANFPLVLTSIRCVEHFQGGPITRNNAHNVDCEPEPWIEINSADAVKYGIKDGSYVNVITARGGSIAAANARRADGDIAPVANWTKGYKARVGAGTLANQRVAPGTVAIPWHWGERGLGVGACANDICIDSWDANTRIPEYKACLCKIVPAATDQS